MHALQKEFETVNEIAKFRRSWDKLEGFLNDWACVLDKRCTGDHDPQVTASYFIWARYSMSIGTIGHLCNPKFLPDLFVIARCCLEFGVSLEAVLSDAQLAQDYLDFEKHVKSKWFKQVQSEGDVQKAIEFRQKLGELGVEEPDEYNWDKWCVHGGGITGLIRKYRRADGMKLYSQLSQFAHGSVVALHILANSPPQNGARYLEKLIAAIYSDYILSTNSFLEKAWGPIATPESDICKNSFKEVAFLFC